MAHLIPKTNRGLARKSQVPGLPELIGVQIRLVGRGYELKADYPAGKPFRTGAFPTDIRVHTGRVTIPIVLRQVADAPPRPRVLLTYQVCTDRLCLPPARQLLPIEVVKE